MADVVIGGFYRRPDSSIVKTIGYYRGLVSFCLDNFEDAGFATQEEIFRDWLYLSDMRDFPNAKDPLLPYEFDLCWDIKYLSDLKRVLASSHPKIGEIKALMVKHQISCEVS